MPEDVRIFIVGKDEYDELAVFFVAMLLFQLEAQMPYCHDILLPNIMTCFLFDARKSNACRNCRAVYIFLMMHPVPVHQVFGNETKSRTLEKVHGQKVIVSWCFISYILLPSWNLSYFSIFT
ncbi:hypothetical protein POTOM_040565 [Populus tomentosa]|uniref:Uncharacterized protein n=1 Tax=Populus tomentosa TaxID=118781 RepID=A0A8X7YQ84_POPTO|nr:hypothetical protein POTOM_040565 [Populus tomentosa]